MPSSKSIEIKPFTPPVSATREFQPYDFTSYPGDGAWGPFQHNGETHVAFVMGGILNVFPSHWLPIVEAPLPDLPVAQEPSISVNTFLRALEVVARSTGTPLLRLLPPSTDPSP